MYVEWYSVCDFVVFSDVEICVAYGGIYFIWIIQNKGIQYTYKSYNKYNIVK